jgi:hypothetical protein
METNRRSWFWGFGFYVASSPSLSDPADIFRFTVTVQFGPWCWRKYFQ